MGQPERELLRVLHEMYLMQVAAAPRIKIADRQVRRLLLRLWEQGDRAVIRGLRGWPLKRKFPASFERKILARVRQRYADSNPTLAAKHLAQEGLSLSRGTTRKMDDQSGRHAAHAVGSARQHFHLHPHQ